MTSTDSALDCNNCVIKCMFLAACFSTAADVKCRVAAITSLAEVHYNAIFISMFLGIMYPVLISEIFWFRT